MPYDRFVETKDANKMNKIIYIYRHGISFDLRIEFCIRTIVDSDPDQFFR